MGVASHYVTPPERGPLAEIIAPVVTERHHLSCPALYPITRDSELNPEPGLKEYMPDEVLKQAMGKYAEVLIIGVDDDDELHVKATFSLQPVEIMNWLLDSVKFKLLMGAYGED